MTISTKFEESNTENLDSDIYQIIDDKTYEKVAAVD
jgi:hypothetical protein